MLTRFLLWFLLSVAILRSASAERLAFRHGATPGRVLTFEPNGITHRLGDELELQDGIAVLYARAGRRLVARLVSLSSAARLFPDLVPDGRITAGDVWLGRGAGAPIDRMLLSSARRLLHETSTATYFGRDQLGNVSLESDAEGTVTGRRAYSPLGSQSDGAGEADRHGFTGQLFDPSGTIHFAFRELDPVTGRWLSADPAFTISRTSTFGRLGESSSAYAYVANNPINRIDPAGLMKRKEPSTNQQQPGKAQRGSTQRPALLNPGQAVQWANTLIALARRLGHASSLQEAVYEAGQLSQHWDLLPSNFDDTPIRHDRRLELSLSTVGNLWRWADSNRLLNTDLLSRPVERHLMAWAVENAGLAIREQNQPAPPLQIVTPSSHDTMETD